MRTTCIALALSFSLAAGVHAGANIKVYSDAPARVWIGGEELGVAPLVMRDLKPGQHEVKIENVRTNQTQSFIVRSPKSGTLEREIRARWSDGAGSQPVAAQPIAAQPVACAQPAVQPIAAPRASIEANAGAAIVADEPEAAPPAKSIVPAKSQARKVLIGAALANEVFNKNKKLKAGLRKGAVGLGLLNEIANK